MVRHIIFDLGNVLVNIYPEKAMQQFARQCGKHYHEIREFFLSELHMEFMRGNIPPTKFYHTVLERYQCNMPYDQFVKTWYLVIGEPKDGIAELINELDDKDYQLSLCSNTDPWHWEVAQQKCPFLQKFRYFFLSFQLQMVKPDIEIFRKILETLQVKGEECVLIDDTLQNLEVAKKLGFLTIHADNSIRIREHLQNLNLL